MEVENGKDALRLGVDYLTLSKPQEENVRDVVREVDITLQATCECAGWKHGYQGVNVCGGLGDVLVRLPGRALDWIRDKNLFSESELALPNATNQKSSRFGAGCVHDLLNGPCCGCTQ